MKKLGRLSLLLLGVVLVLSLSAAGCPQPAPAVPPAVAERLAAAEARVAELERRIAGMVPAPFPIPKPTSFPSQIITAEWLRANIARIPNLRIIDLRTPELFLAGHIPGAVNQPYVGAGALRVTQAEGVVEVRRTIEHFESTMGRLGISERNPVVVYATAGENAGRMLWELNLHGHFDVAVLNGMFPAWTAAGGAVRVGPPVIEPAIFASRFQPQLLASNHYIANAMGNPAYVIVDNRPAPQFTGAVPGAAIVNPGHIPGAINWPLAEYLTGGVTFIPLDGFVTTAKGRGITRDRTIIVTCRTGNASSGLYLMLVAAGYNVRNHDHSWIGWNVIDYLPRHRLP